MDIEMEDNKLIVHLDELEARIASRSLCLLKPILLHTIYMLTRIILLLASLGKEKVKEFQERIERGEDINQITVDIGLRADSLVAKNIEFPTEKELDEALGWLEEK